jgi:hypothetical protein
VFRGGETTGPGNPFLSIYDQVSGNVGFVRGPDELIDFLQYENKATFRWYPTLTTMGDGRVLITDGWEQANVNASDWPHGNPNIPVLYDPSAAPGSEYVSLNGAEYCQQNASGGGSYFENCNANAPNVFNMEEYPWMFLVSNGSVFYARSQYGTPADAGSKRGRLLDPEMGVPPLLGQWTDPGSGADAPIMGGCAVLYAKDRILMTGGATVPHFNGCQTGANFATNQAFIIDPVAPIPPATTIGWAPVAPMLYPRVNHYLVNLPDGTVMALGGSNHVLNNDPPEGMNNSGATCPCVEPDPENPVCTDVLSPCNLCNAVRECERYVP